MSLLETKQAIQSALNEFAAKIVGSGGRPDIAEAGSKDPSKLADALNGGADYFRAKLG
jgi:alanyl-tRNA synthetase